MIAIVRQTTCTTVALVCFWTAALVFAQAPEPRRFDVASVKISPPLPPGGAQVIAGSPQRGGRWISRNAPLIDILRASYPDYRLRGQIVAPDWVARTRFDIDARANGEPARAQMIEMIKLLLADRFALKVRTEPREVDVQALTVARSDGRLGAGLRPSSVDCEAVAAAREKGASPEGPGGRPLCIALSDELPNGLIRVRGSGALVPHLINMIQGPVREPIVDRTGLTSRYDIDLEFNSELGGLRVPDNAAGSSLATALQEQLGLRLDQRKAQLTVLVVENVAMPTPD
jgi:uncharacterized protein (TIGR03435 family)